MNKINNKVNTVFAIAFIAVAVMLVGGLGAAATTTGPATILQKAFAEFRPPNRCVTSQDQFGGTSTSCFVGPDGKEESRELKEDCKDAKEQGFVDKCSSSQTGNGAFCNFAKLKHGELEVNFGEPPCSVKKQ